MKRLAKMRISVAMLCLLIAVAWTPSLKATEEPGSGSTVSSEKSSPEKKEAKQAEEDESAAFKHSGSVKFISKLTGLGVDNTYWLCVVLNFAVIAGLIYWFAKKSLPAVFRNRTAAIQQAMAEARAASEDANRRLAEIESRLARLDGEISQMRGAAEMEAVAEEERIQSATADEVHKVVESAEQEISAAVKSARRDLRAYAANLVVSLAEEQIKVDAVTDQSLVKGFAQRLASDGTSRGDRN